MGPELADGRRDCQRATRGMHRTISFLTDVFSPVLPESSQIRPGLYGFELAYWLAQELEKVGWQASYPEPGRNSWVVSLVGQAQDEFELQCRSAAQGKPTPLPAWEVQVRAFGHAPLDVVCKDVSDALRRFHIEPLTCSEAERAE